MPMTAMLCSLQDKSHLPLKNDPNLLLQKLGDNGDFLPKSPQPLMKIGRTNTNVNNRNLDHDHGNVSFQFQGKIAKAISTGLEGIFCFVYCDVNR